MAKMPQDAFLGSSASKNTLAVGDSPQTPLGQLTALLGPLNGGERAFYPLPKNPSPAVGLRPRISTLWASTVPPPKHIPGYDYAVASGQY